MNKRKRPRIWLLIIACFLIYFAYTAINQQKMIYARNNERRIIEAKIEEEKKQNEELKKQKEHLSSDEYIEKIARERLGMVKHGERIFIDSNK